MEYNFDEQGFVEHFHPNYNCQAIADIDDICCVLDREYEDHDKVVSLSKAVYFDMTDEELKQELHELQGRVLADAMRNYLQEHYQISL